MAVFAEESVSDALERALRNAKHLRARDSATIAAARALARKIDAWDVIVQWAIEDADESGGRPAVPANDNTSLGTFHRYLVSLQLMPPAGEASAVGKAAQPQDALAAFRAKRKVG